MHQHVARRRGRRRDGTRRPASATATMPSCCSSARRGTIEISVTVNTATSARCRPPEHAEDARPPSRSRGRGREDGREGPAGHQQQLREESDSQRRDPVFSRERQPVLGQQHQVHHASPAHAVVMMASTHRVRVRRTGSRRTPPTPTRARPAAQEDRTAGPPTRRASARCPTPHEDQAGHGARFEQAPTGTRTTGA